MKKLIFKNFKWLLVPLVLISSSIGNAYADTWTKVTSEPDSWAGEYLLVYENSSTSGYVWTGVDAASCYASATITSGVISTKPDGAVSLIIAAMTGGYSIKVSGGTNNNKYIKGTSGSNTIGFNASAQLNTITYDTDCSDIVSNTSHMRWNTNRFRYYKSTTYTSSAKVQLYKKSASCSNKVALTKGAETNGSFTLTPAGGSSYDNCDNNFEVVVSSITPNSGYVFDEITVSGAAGKHSITGPDGSGNYTVSYTKGNNITSTINVTFKQACATPTFSPVADTYSNNQSVSISSTAGATIRYTTDGTTPTKTVGTVYSSAITVSSDNTTIKAIAYKDGLEDSSVGSATYRLKCATPTFSVAAGVYKTTQSVTLSCGTTSAVIHYTTDGSTPTGSSPTYSSAISVSSTTTIKAIAVKSGYQDSEVATATYTIMDCDWYESFDDCAGTGGNSGGFSGVSSYGTGTKVVDNSGWTWTNTSTGGGDKCVKLGTSSKQGAAQTPTITVDNGATGRVSFKMAPWDSGTAHIELSGAKITGSVNTTTWDAASAMTSGAWNNYEVDITTTGTSLKITFNSSGYRCWLDEVCVKMEQASYTVSFDANGHGTAPDPITDVTKGSKISKPTPDPSTTGWTFGGWYKEPACTNAWTWATDVVNSDIILYAKWTCVAPTTATVSATGSKWDYCAGESMTLTAGGTGIGDGATYLWKVSHDGGSSYSNAPGTNNASTYSVASMTLAHGGKYTCTISNGSCSTTSSAYDVKVWCVHINNGAAGAYQDIAFTNTGTGTGTANVALDADQSYGFKLWNNNGASIGWYGLDSKTITTTESNITLNSSGANVGINAGLGGTYVFTIDYTSATSPKVSVTYPVGNQPSGRKIWFDKSVITGWTDARTSDLCWRIGKKANSMTNQDATANYFTLVPGTDRFYEYTTKEYNGFEAWHVANNVAWSGNSDNNPDYDNHSIYTHYHNQNSTDVKYATVYQKYVVGTSGVTLVPTTKKNTDWYCDFWYVDKYDGMLTHTATITTPSHGTIHLAYTDINSAAQDKTSTTAGLAHRTILTVTATPATGYNLTSLTVNGAAFTSGNTHILAADATIAATFTAKTVTITWNANGGNTPSPTESSYTYNGSTVALATVTHATKIFAGWWTDPSAGTQITEIGTTNKPSEDVTYYAHWSDGNTVYFHPGVGSVTPTSATQATIGGSVSIPTPTIDCDGWSFAGWNVGSALAETTTNPEASLVAGGSSYVPASAAVHMYAVWKKNFGGGTGPVTSTYDWDDHTTGWTVPIAFSTQSSGGNPNKYATFGQAGDLYITFGSKVAVTAFSCDINRSTNNENGTVYIEYSANNGSTWTSKTSRGIGSFPNGNWAGDGTSFSTTFDGENNYNVRFHYNSSGAATRKIDNMSITYIGDIPDAWKWTSTAEDYGCVSANQVKTPVISPDTEAQTGDVSVTITCATDGATIRYTTDGTNPTSSSGTVYSGAFTVSCSATVKAIAYKATMDDSEIASQAYTVTVPTPTFSLAEGTYYDANQSVTLSLPTAHTGTVIKYTTNGDDPTSSSATYSSAITVTEGTTTIKAIGYNSTCSTSSSVASATYIVRFGTDYTLVTDANDLMAGDQVVIISADAGTSSKYAISTTISSNKRTSTSDYNINAGLTTAKIYPAVGAAATVQVFTLGGEPGAWTFHETTNNGYLNCPSAGKLTNTAVVSNSNKWTIDINGSYVATITNNDVDATIKSNTASGHVFAAYGPATENVQLVKLYSIPNPDPVIKIDADLTAFSACRGIASEAQSIYVSGKNLDGNIVLSNVPSLSGYEFSTDGSSYSATLNLVPVSKTVAKTRVYVRLAATATAGTKNGNLNAAVSANSLSTNIPVTGSVSTADTYTDQIHNQVITNQCGEYYAPSCSDTGAPADESCVETHFKFMGWITETDRNSSAVKNDAWYLEHLITAGTSMTADGTNYYAVWAKEED